jgi:hypothetical protein
MACPPRTSQPSPAAWTRRDRMSTRQGGRASHNTCRSWEPVARRGWGDRAPRAPQGRAGGEEIRNPRGRADGRPPYPLDGRHNHHRREPFPRYSSPGRLVFSIHGGNSVGTAVPVLAGYPPRHLLVSLRRLQRADAVARTRRNMPGWRDGGRTGIRTYHPHESFAQNFRIPHPHIHPHAHPHAHVASAAIGCIGLCRQLLL